MTYFESLGFVYRLVLERFDFVIWVWAMVAFVASFVFLHWLWGLAWNSQWSVFKRPGVTAASFTLALIASGSVLTWLAADRSVTWLELQRTELVRQLTDNGAHNRRIFIDAREHIGQGPGTDENAMMLRNERNLLVLAEVAAKSVRCPLTPSGPLGPDAPCRVRDPASVAQEVVRTVPTPSFPLTVSPDNPWIRSAVTAQVQGALSYASPRLRAGITELSTLVQVLFWLALGIQALMVPIYAVDDIRVHPSV